MRVIVKPVMRRVRAYSVSKNGRLSSRLVWCCSFMWWEGYGRTMEQAWNNYVAERDKSQEKT